MRDNIPDSIMLADANILIDFLKADQTALRELCQRITIGVPRSIIQDEIRQLSIEDAISMGISILDANIEQLVEASTGSTRISFYDKLCLIITRDNGYTCISNDRKLHLECEQQNVNIIWGLDLLLYAVEKKIFSKERCILCFSRIQSVNARISQKIEDEFLASLNEITD